MRPRSKPRFDDKAQFERFVETARKLGVEEVGAAFDEAFEKIVPAKSPHARGRPFSSQRAANFFIKPFCG